MNTKRWDTLTRIEQNLYLTLLWVDGYSEKAIADFFSTTKGRIVRRRQTVLKLPTKGRPPARAKVDSERFADLLDLHAMEGLEAQGVASIAPPKLEAKTEKRIQICMWPLSTHTKIRPVVCGKPAVEGHRLCQEHLSIVQRTL